MNVDYRLENGDYIEFEIKEAPLKSMVGYKSGFFMGTNPSGKLIIRDKNSDSAPWNFRPGQINITRVLRKEDYEEIREYQQAKIDAISEAPRTPGIALQIGENIATMPKVRFKVGSFIIFLDKRGRKNECSIINVMNDAIEVEKNQERAIFYFSQIDVLELISKENWAKVVRKKSASVAIEDGDFVKLSQWEFDYEGTVQDLGNSTFEVLSSNGVSHVVHFDEATIREIIPKAKHEKHKGSVKFNVGDWIQFCSSVYKKEMVGKKRPTWGLVSSLSEENVTIELGKYELLNLKPRQLHVKGVIKSDDVKKISEIESTKKKTSTPKVGDWVYVRCGGSGCTEYWGYIKEIQDESLAITCAVSGSEERFDNDDDLEFLGFISKDSAEFKSMMWNLSRIEQEQKEESPIDGLSETQEKEEKKQNLCSGEYQSKIMVDVNDWVSFIDELNAAKYGMVAKIALGVMHVNCICPGTGISLGCEIFCIDRVTFVSILDQPFISFPSSIKIKLQQIQDGDTITIKTNSDAVVTGTVTDICEKRIELEINGEKEDFQQNEVVEVLVNHGKWTYYTPDNWETKVIESAAKYSEMSRYNIIKAIISQACIQLDKKFSRAIGSLFDDQQSNWGKMVDKLLNEKRNKTAEEKAIDIAKRFRDEGYYDC